MRINKLSKFLTLIVILFLLVGCQSQEETTLLFVGSFTDKKPGKGIHVYEFNNENGKIGAFAIDSADGKLDLINIQDCRGLNPAHIEIDKTGRFLTSSQYSDGSLSVFKIRDDGGLNPHTQVLQFKDSSVVKNRQEASHIHSSNFSHDYNFLFAHDLGADKIRRFSFNATSQDSMLQNKGYIEMKPGSGPRHFKFHPNGKFGYSVSELSGKLTAFNYNNGDLEFIEDYQSYEKQQDIYRAADIHISPDGHFLYASNRGPAEDSISIFSIDISTGRLNLIGHEPTYGKHPRNFTLDPSGKFLLVVNQFSGNIVIFSRNIETGKLTKLSKEILVDNPSSLQMRTYSIGL
jgi:6-phosphogluconolactonase (cycloisomerase 2 family)